VNDPPPPEDDNAGVRNAGARLITVLLNPAAGRTQTEERCARAMQAFAAAGAEAQVMVLRSAAAAPDAARQAIAAGASTIVAAGGDGTISAVASVLAETTTPLGVLPLGTLNHFARDVGIPQDPEPAVATIVAGHVRKVDIGEVNGRTFLNNASIGIYPDVVVERERLQQLGHYKWIAFALASTRILRRYRRLVVRLTAGDAIERARTAFLLVGNNEYQVDGLSLGARPRLDDGRLFAYLAPRVHTRDLPKLFALALAGRARERQALESVAGTEFHVDTPGLRRLRVALDGEVIVLRPPLRFRVRPAALRVITRAG
jgi:YegS/Rv2252/BmrU family lipid kinase